MAFIFLILSIVLLTFQATAPQPSSAPNPPVRIAPSITQSNDLTTCPPLNFSAHRETLQQGIEEYYQDLPCSCGGARGWTRAAYLNMSDTSQRCPNNLTLITTPARGCRRKNENFRVCDSIIYPVRGLTYSRVCGRILAYGKGALSAFDNSVTYNLNTIERPYLTGVSLTHGAPGSRQHIWSFAAGLYEHDDGIGNAEKCPCSVSNYAYRLPSFLNDNYFCESGIQGSNYGSTTYYPNDPLWDGQGCGTSMCCQFNTPPWFCTSLPQPTSDNLEIRNCYEGSIGSEDIVIRLIDIYVK